MGRQIPWTEHISKLEVLKKMRTQKAFILTIKKRVGISGTHYKEEQLRKLNILREGGVEGNSKQLTNM